MYSKQDISRILQAFDRMMHKRTRRSSGLLGESEKIFETFVFNLVLSM